MIFWARISNIEFFSIKFLFLFFCKMKFDKENIKGNIIAKVLTKNNYKKARNYNIDCLIKKKNIN